MGWCGEKNNHGREGILNIHTSSKLEFFTINNFCNVCAFTLIRERVFIFKGTHRGRDLY